MRELAKQISPNVWEIPPSAKTGMRVPARILASPGIFATMDDGVFEQITNVATLPGIQRHALCMPDGHWGYGFPIGGVAAFDLETGVISPGGIGFDINCGMRLLRTNLTLDEVRPRLASLMDTLYSLVPCGVGSKGVLRLSESEYRQMTTMGAGWCVERGYGWPEDPDHIEEQGCIPSADPDQCSSKAVQRGLNQLGTLGSGNHYLEVQVVRPENVFDAQVAQSFGIGIQDQICVMVHCGSRGFGHQVATDYLRAFGPVMTKHGITMIDKELACAPFSTPEARSYFGAMNCAANSAFANRQVITHRIREAFAKTFGKNELDMGLEIIYDVAHNIAKVERYEIDGKTKDLLVHRKGATRSFGPGQVQLPVDYRDIGQPVIVGGSMETGSYLLVGTQRAMDETFGSTLHGSGRTMSRTKAKTMIKGEKLRQSLLDRGIAIRTASLSGLAEEAGFAYKDISEVVAAVHNLGISRRVVRFLPIGNIKG
ncbi:MAG: RtcB family protein [candidate division Zixibacteria bacterium]|nr:RtcB family protein [candidate division Zixibacteria bacterium]